MVSSERKPIDHPRLKRLSNVTERYDRWAGLYDLNPILKLVQPARYRAIKTLNLKPGDTAIDMGTGTGANLKLLRNAVGQSGKVVAIDASQEMVERALERVDDHGWENVTVLLGDIRKPPLDESVDGICSTFVAGIYDDPDTLLEPWADLVESGTIVTLYTGPSQRRYGPVVNALLRFYLRIVEESEDVGKSQPPLEILSRRGDRFRTAMNHLATDAFHEEYGLGLLKLDIGRF